ncbi:hypothetical protein OAL32_00280 [Synechococcus sp. AH-551-G15]|nr:hypothetical protein [Synechococcus sp. AH-551-G15]
MSGESETQSNYQQTMASVNLDWKASPLPLNEYKVTKLPRGTDNCFEEFRPVHHTLTGRRGPKGSRSEQEDLQEAERLYKAKEAKLLKSED